MYSVIIGSRSIDVKISKLFYSFNLKRINYILKVGKGQLINSTGSDH